MLDKHDNTNDMTSEISNNYLSVLRESVHESIGLLLRSQALSHLLYHRVVQVQAQNTVDIKEIGHRLRNLCFSCLLCLSIGECHAQVIYVVVPGKIQQRISQTGAFSA